MVNETVPQTWTLAYKLLEQAAGGAEKIAEGVYFNWDLKDGSARQRQGEKIPSTGKIVCVCVTLQVRWG